MVKTGIFSEDAEHSAAKLLVNNFRCLQMFSSIGKVNVVDLWNALMMARACCGSDNFGDCMRWAKKVVRKKKNVGKKRANV